ncbi:hypothetical protein BGW38_010728 [Lunasporangiospora selenospora]|uniref:Uncharacterized protein n=1 Tax=Lunasporangiospora selenospora TaxID=979761 RepID=A0A9P6FWN2_9FUNG|nr:hypothetical protein BGW38_010728 [Lunasporangiospora selenospora]
MRYPCGGYPPGPVTKMKAGQVIDVRFYASAMKSNDLKKQPKLSKSTKQFAQARHGGGMCEFSLSYDGGKSYRLIGRYSKTCPDSYYTWPVRIPKNAKSCTKKNQCLFVWTWTAAVVPQFYMNCADIQLSGAKNGVYPPRKGIQVYNIKGHKKKVFPGDGQKHKAGPGPNKKEINNNMNDRF